MSDESLQDPEERGAAPTKSTEDETAPTRDPVRRITRIVLVVCAVVFVVYLLSDRHTPYTDQANVQALIVPIVPRVAGHLTEVNVRLHSIVAQGDALFQLDRRPFELAVRTAEASFDNASQQVGALSATVKSAAGRLGSSRAQLDRAQRNFNRTQRILEKNPGALSQADRDRTETSLDQAVERVASAEADLDRAKQQLGTTGPDNSQLRAAIVALEKAQLDLAFTTIHAPAEGVIESFNVDIGHFAAAGQPLATFVSTNDVWIQADMRENNISRVDIGDRVEFTLDVAPGRVFEGRVRSVGYGVSSSGGSGRGSLPTVRGSTGWLREPQRFPVIIAFDQEPVAGLLRAGGQADVVIYTGRRPVLNAIGRLNIRLKSLLSFVR